MSIAVRQCIKVFDGHNINALKFSRVSRVITSMNELDTLPNEESL